MLISFAAPIASAQRYAITDLGALYSPAGIDKQGRIVGNLNGTAQIWTYHGLENLGTLPGGTFSYATAINDSGTIVGMADGSGNVVAVDGSITVSCADLTQAFVYTASTAKMKGLGALGVGQDGDYLGWCAISSYANSINNSAQIVGTNDWVNNTYEDGFISTPTPPGIQIVPGPPGYYNDRVNAIGSGEGPWYVGMNECCGGVVSGHAMAWDVGKTGTSTIDLGTLGGPDPDNYFCSEAMGINSPGQIVGYSTISAVDYAPCETPPQIHAFLVSADSLTMSDLGTLDGDISSAAYKINLSGQVIGVSGNTLTWVGSVPQEEGYPRPVPVGHPFLWTSTGGMVDLNSFVRADLGWVLLTATDINTGGQIVGSGTLHGQTHGFLLTPIR
jgi:probable HAF family extracellular repeat protein